MQTTPSHTLPVLPEYCTRGFVIIREFRNRAAVDEYARHYMQLRATGPRPGDYGGNNADRADPLNTFPRMIDMGDWDAQTRAWSQAPDLLAIVAQLLADTPVLKQTMLYFKPPGARGQGLHQDEQFINCSPLLGAWLALDDCDDANGCMQMVDGSHRRGLLPVTAADISSSFVPGQTTLPADAVIESVPMQAGDLLLFDGKTIHGSLPNTTTDRFRRSFICHFIGARSQDFEPPSGYHMSHLDTAATSPGEQPGNDNAKGP